MTWHYGVIRKKVSLGVYRYEIYEIFHCKRSNDAYTVDPITPSEESLEELIRVLTMMLNDIKRFPVYEETGKKKKVLKPVRKQQ